MKVRNLEKLQRMEYLAHINAFTETGLFYWENFLIQEDAFKSKYGPYLRRW